MVEDSANMVVVTAMILAGAIFLGCCPYLVGTLLKEDRFLERLYNEYLELWMKLGRPRGWLWSPPARVPPGLAIKDDLGANTEKFDWLNRDEPLWLEQYPALIAEYRNLRMRIRFWNFVIMPAFFALVGVAGVTVAFTSK